MATPTNLPASFTTGQVLTATQQNDLRGAFRILQVVTGTNATFTTYNTTTYSDSGVTATITPQSTSSKILVVAFMNGTVRGAEDAANHLNFQILRGATKVQEVLQLHNTGTALLQVGTCTMQILDSPASTSALVYKVQGKNGRAGSTVGSQYQNTTSSIILYEVSA